LGKQNIGQDNFYTKSNVSWDASRLPLIKPYEAIKLNGTDKWSINLQDIPGSISNVKEINIIKNTIIIHAGETYCNNEKVQEAWFIIIPEKHIENGFQQKIDFDKYLLSIKISNYQLYDIGYIFKKFYINKELDWNR
jgi:hypothetical protein